MIWLFVGPPASGKDTQAKMLAEKYGLKVISTGQAFREEIAAGTELGRRIKPAYDRGDLVSDEDMRDVIKSRLMDIIEEDVIITGYLRTATQVNHLLDISQEIHLDIAAVVNFQLSDDEIVERISGRLYAPKAQRYYHKKFNPPQTPGIDDETGENLIRRPDDEPAAVRKRLEIYHDKNQQILEQIRQLEQLKLINIDASQSIQQVHQDLKQQLFNFPQGQDVAE